MYATLWQQVVSVELRVKDGILTLYDVLFQRTCAQVAPENDSLNYNSHRKPVRFQI